MDQIRNNDFKHCCKTPQKQYFTLMSANVEEGVGSSFVQVCKKYVLFLRSSNEVGMGEAVPGFVLFFFKQLFGTFSR